MMEPAILFAVGLLISYTGGVHSQHELILIPNERTVTIPSETTELSETVTLICGIESEMMIMALETRWSTPEGLVINETMGRYMVQLSEVEEDQMHTMQLSIDQLSFSDSGNYTCQARDPSTDAFSKWTQATIELKLLMTIKAIPSHTLSIDASTDEIELQCDMSDYIRPDKDFQWYRNNITIENIDRKYSISYRDGTDRSAQNGGLDRVPSRVIVLTVHGPDELDSGTYTCKVQGTIQQANIELTVNSTPESNTTATSTNVPKSSILKVTAGVIVGVSLLMVNVLFLVIIAMICFNKSDKLAQIREAQRHTEVIRTPNGSYRRARIKNEIDTNLVYINKGLNEETEDSAHTCESTTV